MGSSHDQLIRFRTAVEKLLEAHEARRGKPRTSCCLLILDVCCSGFSCVLYIFLADGQYNLVF
jgi:hypothetical protein